MDVAIPQLKEIDIPHDANVFLRCGAASGNHPARGPYLRVARHPKPEGRRVAEQSGAVSNPQGSQARPGVARSARPIGAVSEANWREIWKTGGEFGTVSEL